MLSNPFWHMMFHEGRFHYELTDAYGCCLERSAILSRPLPICGRVVHHVDLVLIQAFVAGGPKFKTIEIGILELITADFAAGAVMITFGAVLGKASPLEVTRVCQRAMTP